MAAIATRSLAHNCRLNCVYYIFAINLPFLSPPDILDTRAPIRFFNYRKAKSLLLTRFSSRPSRRPFYPPLNSDKLVARRLARRLFCILSHVIDTRHFARGYFRPESIGLESPGHEKKNSAGRVPMRVLVSKCRDTCVFNDAFLTMCDYNNSHVVHRRGVISAGSQPDELPRSVELRRRQRPQPPSMRISEIFRKGTPVLSWIRRRRVHLGPLLRVPRPTIPGL